MDQENMNPSWKLSVPHILVAILVPFLFGYHMGFALDLELVLVVNEPLESISIDLGFSGNTLAEGLVVSTCLAGAFVGSLLSGWIADRFGRRKAFQLCALPMIIGACTSAMTTNLEGMLLGRFLVGSGLGVGPPVASLYVAEGYFWKLHSNCTMSWTNWGSGSLESLSRVLQAAKEKGINAAISSAALWRTCFWVSTIPAAILALAMVFCAESTLAVQAEAEFEKLLGGSHVKSAIAELSKSDRGDETDTMKFLELLCGRYSRVVFIGSTLFALQQLSGINAVFYFSSTVFRSAGVSSNLANIFVGIANLLGSVVALISMDKLGRKVLLMWSFCGMALSTALQVTAAGLSASGSGALYLSIGGMLLFVLTFSIGAGPVPGLLLPEIFPSRIRAKSHGILYVGAWGNTSLPRFLMSSVNIDFSIAKREVFNFIVGLLFLRLLEQLGPRFLYSIFGAFCLMAVVFVKKNVLETKGKTLQEIEIALLPED
ncbi:major facilitator superfamily protein [Actinidia rufa]|uniref:Major facilitator superfamily protein n=1 Tax=Actinidia rufa TaxID=165716 RepID=A0A7J0FI57_9ERIC|nr:major facilitator superfamily protein [Actinidia rufa]